MAKIAEINKRVARNVKTRAKVKDAHFFSVDPPPLPIVVKVFTSCASSARTRNSEQRNDSRR